MLLAHDPKGPDDLSASMAIANADDVQALGITRNGIKVAVKVHRWSTKPGAWTCFGIAWDVSYRPRELRFLGERRYYLAVP